MRVKFADNIAHCARRFFWLRPGGQAQFAHRIDNPALHRLQAVAEMRQRAIENHVHRIIEIGLLGKILQRNLLDALEVELILNRHKSGFL